MPFKSRSQIGTCYQKRSRSSSKGEWNCDKWLDETPSVCCLPYRKGDTVKSRCMKKGERIKGKIQTGPRGGKFFTITEKDANGEICTMKVYTSNRK